MEEIQNNFRKVMNLLAYSCLLFIASCKPSTEAIDYGREACNGCKMTIVDARFACELVTAKGRVYKFDDILCMKDFAGKNAAMAQGATFWVCDYAGEKSELIDATQCIFLKGDAFTSPMGGNSAAFANENAAKSFKDSMGLQYLKWNNL